jgi:hypothetical protein
MWYFNEGSDGWYVFCDGDVLPVFGPLTLKEAREMVRRRNS